MHCQTTTTGRFPRTLKEKSKWQQQFTTVWNIQQNQSIAISVSRLTE